MKMSRNKLLTTLFVAGLSMVAFAQMEPGTPPPETSFDNSPAISETKSLNDVLDDYLKSKKWQLGENKKPDGSLFFVATGTGVIQAPRTDNNYTSARVAAYEMAMLAAKQQMAEYVGSVISTSVSRTYEEGNFDLTGLQDDDSSIVNKAKTLLEAKLDKALRAEGIDPETATKDAVDEALKKQISSEDFQKTVKSVAQTFISGLQASKTFEISPANAKGQIGVVAIWSPKLQKMAEVMALGGTVPTGIPKKKIADQIPSDPEVLLSTYGVQQFLDENGNLTLVSYAQSTALSDSPTSVNAARNKANLDAAGAIRQFAGENVLVVSEMTNAQTAKEFEDGMDEYSNTSRFREKIKAVADGMKISGIVTLKNWQFKHPLSGKTVYGVICTWNPTSAENAQALGKLLNDRPKPAAGAGSASKPKSEKEKEAQGKSFEGSGSAADDDAF